MSNETTAAEESTPMEVSDTTPSTEDSEYDEALVYVEFTGLGVTNVLNQKKPEFKVIGLLENEPKIQLGGQVYAGEALDDTVGTYVFFEQTEEPPDSFDQELSIKRPEEAWYKYVCKTHKELIVKRVYIKKRAQDTNGEPSTSTIDAKPSLENQQDN